jgi:hypothetical protein
LDFEEQLTHSKQRSVLRLNRYGVKIENLMDALLKLETERIGAELSKEVNMSSYVLGFQDIDKTKIMVVGGKGANLGGNLQG